MKIPQVYINAYLWCVRYIALVGGPFGVSLILSYFGFEALSGLFFAISLIICLLHPALEFLRWTGWINGPNRVYGGKNSTAMTRTQYISRYPRSVFTDYIKCFSCGEPSQFADDTALDGALVKCTRCHLALYVRDGQRPQPKVRTLTIIEHIVALSFIVGLIYNGAS